MQGIRELWNAVAGGVVRLVMLLRVAPLVLLVVMQVLVVAG